jgi:hypothetical protein
LDQMVAELKTQVVSGQPSGDLGRAAAPEDLVRRRDSGGHCDVVLILAFDFG